MATKRYGQPFQPFSDDFAAGAIGGYVAGQQEADREYILQKIAKIEKEEQENRALSGCNLLLVAILYVLLIVYFIVSILYHNRNY